MSKLIMSLLFAATLCSANSITYNVDLNVEGGSITGDIVTDGTIGLLTPSLPGDIIDFNLVLSDGVHTFDLLGPLSGSTAGYAIFGLSSGLTATPTQLLFNFSGNGNLLFQFDLDGNGGPFVCFETNANCTGNPAGISFTPDLANFYFTPESGTQVIANTGAPEPSTFVLFGAGIAILRSRKRWAGRAALSPYPPAVVSQ